MLKSASSMKGLTIRATDGDIGRVDQFLFDDENWAIRNSFTGTAQVRGSFKLKRELASGTLETKLVADRTKIR